MKVRPRRLRSSSAIRDLISESSISENDLIYPLFVVDKNSHKEAIRSMPGQFRLGRSELNELVKELISKGLKSVCLFPKIDESLKDSHGTYSYSEKNYYLDRIKELKDKFPELLVMTDVALDPYSSDGHDGIVDKKTGKILNDETVEILAKMSLAQAKAGADIIGPSDMMDGRVKAIRKSLEDHNFQDVLIMSYTAKYASSFYGPFRDALDSAPKGGDKKSYQMDIRNSMEAIKEAKLDELEGADILMVKPGIAYLDILAKLKETCVLPLSIYQVSGEYSMIKAAGERGWINEEAVMLESLISFKRAGASIILSYFTQDFLNLR